MPASSSSSSRAGSDGPDSTLSERLLMLSDDPDYTLTQMNGQRIYRKMPHAWKGPEPTRDCEVFVGRVPHDCFEDDLIPLFKTAGELYEFRLMINFSGYNRGYAFAMYTNKVGARNAIRMFDNHFIRQDWQLGVCESVNNCRLLVSRIPADTRSQDVVRVLHQLTDEVKELRIKRNDKTCTALVEYKSHRGAAMARKALVAAGHAWGGNVRPSVDWTAPIACDAHFPELGHYDATTGLIEASDVQLGMLRVQIEYLPPPWPMYSDAPLFVNRQHTRQLGPGGRERRLRMIQEAQRSSQPLAGGSSSATTGIAVNGVAVNGVAVNGVAVTGVAVTGIAINGNQLARQADRFFERNALVYNGWGSEQYQLMFGAATWPLAARPRCDVAHAGSGDAPRPVTGAWRPEPAADHPRRARSQPGEFDPWRPIFRDL